MDKYTIYSQPINGIKKKSKENLENNLRQVTMKIQHNKIIGYKKNQKFIAINIYIKMKKESKLITQLYTLRN